MIRGFFLCFALIGSFRALLNQFPAKLSRGSGHFVVLYLPRAQSKKLSEITSRVTLVLGEIFLLFGHFGLFWALLGPP